MAKPVKIEVVAGTIIVDPDEIHVSFSKKEEVHWTHKGGKNFSVEFRTSPFKDSHFDDAKSNSGAPIINKGTFKYTVSTEGITKDPSVIIDA